MKSVFLSMTVFVLLFSLQSCKKENNQSGVNLKLKTTGSTRFGGRMASSTSEINSRTTGVINWTSGYASATEIKFETEQEDDGDEIEFKTTTNQKIDLFAPLSSLGFISIPPGTYEEIEFKVKLVSSGSDASLELRGTYNGTPVVFKVNNAVEIEAEFENITIADAQDITAIISMNLDLLTNGISESELAAATLTNGEIIISADSNAGLYAIITSNIAKIDDVEIEYDDDDEDDD